MSTPRGQSINQTSQSQIPVKSEATRHYDVFISYARKDNNTGWVSAIKDLIDADARSLQG